MVWLLPLSTSVVIIFVLKAWTSQTGAFKCWRVIVSSQATAPPSLEWIVPLNLCLLPCCKSMWGSQWSFSLLSVSLLSLSLSPSLALSFSFFCFGYRLIKVDILAHIPVKHVSGAGIKELPRPVIDFPLKSAEPPANNPQRFRYLHAFQCSSYSEELKAGKWGWNEGSEMCRLTRWTIVRFCVQLKLTIIVIICELFPQVITYASPKLLIALTNSDFKLLLINQRGFGFINGNDTGHSQNIRRCTRSIIVGKNIFQLLFTFEKKL